jgi:hypothetical protein
MSFTATKELLTTPPIVATAGEAKLRILLEVYGQWRGAR